MSAPLPLQYEETAAGGGGAAGLLPIGGDAFSPHAISGVMQAGGWGHWGAHAGHAAPPSSLAPRLRLRLRLRARWSRTGAGRHPQSRRCEEFQGARAALRWASHRQQGLTCHL